MGLLATGRGCGPFHNMENTMESAANTVVDNTTKKSKRCFSRSGSDWGRKGSWTGFNIAAMVIGFVFFWPVGLVILYWIIRGRDLRDLPAAAREKWSQMFGRSKGGPSGNIVFEEYQQTQYDRIREIKEEIRERGRRFADFREDAKRRADQEEFNQFMASSPATNGQ